ncbi:unnamed protein product [Orchesella dallaii]|uniref:Zinc finger protein n=1 Tax=Orchesella dallaii TaxID=48710 RepID=A0ABP1S9I0_9HEXA
MNTFIKTEIASTSVSCPSEEADGSRSVTLPVLDDVSSEFETIISDQSKVCNGEDNPRETIIDCSSLNHPGEMLINTIEVSTEELMGMDQINSEDIEFIYSPNIQFHMESITSSHHEHNVEVEDTEAICEIANSLDQVPVTLSEVTGNDNETVGVTEYEQKPEPRLVANQGKTVNEDDISKAILQAASNILQDHGSKQALRLNAMKVAKNIKKISPEESVVAEASGGSSFENVIITNVQGGVTNIKSLVSKMVLRSIDGKSFAFEHSDHDHDQQLEAPSSNVAEYTPENFNDGDCGLRSIIISPGSEFQILNMESQLPSIIETATVAQQTVNAALSAQATLPASTSLSNTVGVNQSNVSANSRSLQGSEMIQVEGLGGTSLKLQKYYCQPGLCRVCLLVKENLTSIFEDITIDSNGMVENARGPNAAHRFNILAALQTLLDIDVKYNDGLPETICMECYDQLMNFSVYRKRVAIGQTKLNQILFQVKDSKAPTFIPSLGEEDIQKTEIYRHSASIITAKNIVQNSQYSHLVLRKLSDRVWDKIFSSMSAIVGYKSGKLRNLESYACERPYVVGFFCYTCNSTVHGSKEDYALHYDEFHGIKCLEDVLYPCDICGNGYPLKDTSAMSQSYSEHWLQHFFLHECTFCSKKLPSTKGLWVHKKSAHGAREKIFVCSNESCDKSFFKKSHLDAHKRTHLESSTQKEHTSFCHLCGKGLHSSLTAHINSVHGSERPWRCNICQKQFKRKEILLEHRESVHSNTKKFECEICGETFKSQSSKAVHLLRHKGEKSHVCPVCSKDFYSVYALKSHMVMHQEGGNFPCPDCGKVFKRKSYLEEHKRTHTGEKPFKCPICGKAIRMKPNYFKHMRIHKRKNEVP